MSRFDIVKESPTPEGFRAAKIQGMFDIPLRKKESVHIQGNITLPDEWTVGLITGPSGIGKTSVARELWPDNYFEPQPWVGDCILDDFAEGLSPKQITDALIGVGFSSPPVWLRPYRVLSTGQQFRADLARALADPVRTNPLVFDEFTSVVDRTVAKSASVALRKYLVKHNRQFIGVTCHMDVAEWIEADWVYDMATGVLRRDRLRRPRIALRICEGTRKAWPVFSGHHYMTSEISPSARVFLAVVELDGVERLAGFFSVIPAIGFKGWRRGHRTVVLPDFQGLGIGNKMIELTAEYLWNEENTRFRAVTAAPGIIYHRQKHPDMWRCVAAPHMKMKPGKSSALKSTSAGRLTTSWEYVPKALRTGDPQ